MADKKLKIKLLREIENAAGLQKFYVDEYSTHFDIDDSLLQCIRTIEILEYFKDKIDEVLEIPEEELTYSIIDESSNNY